MWSRAASDPGDSGTPALRTVNQFVCSNDAGLSRGSKGVSGSGVNRGKRKRVLQTSGKLGAAPQRASLLSERATPDRAVSATLNLPHEPDRESRGSLSVIS